MRNEGSSNSPEESLKQKQSSCSMESRAHSGGLTGSIVIFLIWIHRVAVELDREIVRKPIAVPKCAMGRSLSGVVRRGVKEIAGSRQTASPASALCQLISRRPLRASLRAPLAENRHKTDASHGGSSRKRRRRGLLLRHSVARS